MRRTAESSFNNLLQYLQYEAYVQYGAESGCGIDQSGKSLTFSLEEVATKVVLEWRFDSAKGTIDWCARREQNDDARSVGDLSPISGQFPKRNPALRVLALIAELVPRPKPKLIQPRERLAIAVFGLTFGLGIFALLRLFAVSVPPDRWAEGGGGLYQVLPQVAETMRQLASALSLADLPSIVVGSFVNQPALGFTIAAVVAVMFIVHTLPRVAIGSDVLSWRTIAIYVTAVFSTIMAIALTPNPWKVPLGLIALYVAYSIVSLSVVPWQIERWLRFSRKVRISSIASVENRTGYEDSDGVAPSLAELAEALEERALFARRKVWKKRDKAFESARYRDAYFQAREVKTVLAREFKAARKEKEPRTRLILASLKCDAIHWGFESFCWRALFLSSQ